MPIVARLVALLELWYPPATAQGWDTVGLAAGDPAAQVEAVHVAVDPTAEVAAEAVRGGAGLLLVHHPLWLGGTTSLAAGTRHGDVLATLRSAALYVAHTNADVANPGVSDALAAALGLRSVGPLTQPGHLGRLGILPAPQSLQDFCHHVAARLPATASGVRATGDPAAPVWKVAVAGGACLDLAAAATAAGADVLVTSDAKHHRAQEAPLPVVDVAHWAGEWPWTQAVAARLRAAAPGLTVTVSEQVTDPWTVAVGSPGWDRTDRRVDTVL